ncbi:MAG: DegT/DnrJ/EryC1/StrS family aminotransferase [Alphaproteobacteria bacterium]|nr:DegT/DnrJ/EryC1/StrS family aminotransferase [Alphaproteobacteria bacterium]
MSDIQMAGPMITEADEAIVRDAVANGWYGEKAYSYVEKFEAGFAAYHGRTYGLMTPNCTTALHLLLAALDISAGDEVIVPDCTWVGTSACITYQGAHIVFADIDPDHWCITPNTLERAITGRTKAAIIVDLYGNMPDWDGLREVAQKRGILLIEDAAEAIGSTFRGVRAGKFGIASAFSFHRTKTITTGEGGMLLLDDKTLFERCSFLRDHGREPGKYYVSEIAFKYMPFNVQASLGYAQFLRIDELVEKKRWIWKQYRESLADVPDIFFNPEPDHVHNGVWCTSLVFGSSWGMTKDRAMAELRELGLPSRPFFYPLSSLPAYPGREEGGRQDSPVSYDISARAINLPSALNLTEDQIDRMCAGIRQILG